MKQKGEFYKVKKSGFSIVVIVDMCFDVVCNACICCQKKEPFMTFQFFRFEKSIKRSWKQEKNVKSAWRLKTKEQGKFNVWLLHIRDRNVSIMMFCWNIKRKVKEWTGNFTVNKGMEKGIWKIWCVTADKNYDEEYHYSC